MLEKKEEEGINFHEKCNHDCIESGQLFLSLIECLTGNTAEIM